jgi:hypothetical protein
MDERTAKLAMLSEAEDLLLRVSAGQDPFTFVNAALTAIGSVALSCEVCGEFPEEAPPPCDASG